MEDFNPNLREQALMLSLNELKIEFPSKTIVFSPSGSGNFMSLLDQISAFDALHLRLQSSVLTKKNV